MLPAHAVLSRGGRAAQLVLVPDLATYPLHVYRPALGRLLGLRGIDSGCTTSTLVVSTTEARRDAWLRLLDDLARSRRDAPLLAYISTWRQLDGDASTFGQVVAHGRTSSTFAVRAPRLRRLSPRQRNSPIPRPVGTPFRADSSGPDLGSLALEIAPIDRPLLDLIGRHPFLPADRLASALGWETRKVRERRARLIHLGLVRLLGDDERRPSIPADLTELTTTGAEIVAAQQGLSLSRAVEVNGVVGGGPEHPTAPADSSCGTWSTRSVRTPFSRHAWTPPTARRCRR